MTENYKYVQELLQTGAGTQGTLLIPRKIYDTLIDEVDYTLIPRSEAAFVIGPSGIPGSSIELNFVNPESADIRLVGESAEIPMAEAIYTTVNIKPDKYGAVFKITGEMMEDSQFDMNAHNIKYLGKKFAENENSLVISQALESAGNTISGGTAITIANIARAIQYLEDNDFNASTFLVGTEVANDLRNIDTFVEADKFGSREMLQTGFIGNLYGMRVVRVSTNAGMTTTTSYVIDRTQAYCIVEKRPLTMESFEMPTHDLKGVAFTHRIRARALRANAIAKITTS